MLPLKLNLQFMSQKKGQVLSKECKGLLLFARCSVDDAFEHTISHAFLKNLTGGARKTRASRTSAPAPRSPGLPAAAPVLVLTENEWPPRRHTSQGTGQTERGQERSVCPLRGTV